MRIKIIFLTTLILAAPALAESRRDRHCKDPSSWPAEQAAAIKERCDRVAKAQAMRKKQEEKTNAWIEEHGKSNLMVQIFKSHNSRIPEETATAEEITWTYKTSSVEMAQCKEFVFGTAGDLKSRRVFKCKKN